MQPSGEIYHYIAYAVVLIVFFIVLKAPKTKK